MFKYNTVAAVYVCLVLLVSLQLVSCKSLVGKQKRMYLRRRLNKRGDTVPLGISLSGSPAATNPNTASSFPSISASNVQLPPLPDASGLFSSISSVSSLTQQIPNLGAAAAASPPPQSATGTTQFYHYVPQNAAPAPVAPVAQVFAPLPAAPQEQEKDDEKDDDNDDDDEDEDEDDD